MNADFEKYFKCIIGRKNNLNINYVFGPMRECCTKEYDNLSLINAWEICYKTSTSKRLWDIGRKYRITGSRCYSLYTYTSNKNPNWITNSLKYFIGNSFTNKFVKHGIEMEPLAKLLYKYVNPDCTIFEPSLLVCQDNPWLGYSADGIIFQPGMHTKLLEIKCPYNGKTEGIKYVIQNCKYLVKENDVYTLKTRHAYYEQVQLGMFVNNLASTDFCIYSSYDNGMYIINKQKNEESRHTGS